MLAETPDGMRCGEVQGCGIPGLRGEGPRVLPDAR